MVLFPGIWGGSACAVEGAEEFAPLDKVISLQLPGMDMVAAEAGRQLIRDKYAQVQEQIDAAATPDEIKAALEAAS